MKAVSNRQTLTKLPNIKQSTSTMNYSRQHRTVITNLRNDQQSSEASNTSSDHAYSTVQVDQCGLSSTSLHSSRGEKRYWEEPAAVFIDIRPKSSWCTCRCMRRIEGVASARGDHDRHDGDGFPRKTRSRATSAVVDSVPRSEYCNHVVRLQSAQRQ